VTRPWRDVDEDAAEAKALVCSVCAQRITDEAQRIDRGGAHEHTFVNPGGFAHRVRCFGAAGGIAGRGVPERAFAWFPGYSWQILHCSRCDVHIGWLFRGPGDAFYGFVAERLVER
jgi:hypothetical protein